MALNTKTLRIAFAAGAAAVLIVVLGFYGYARYRIRSAIHDVPKKLGLDVQQSASGFKITKSEGGRMLFSIAASSAVQYKGSERAALKDARIIVYNRGKGTSNPATDIYDQIYGKEFEYDHSSGEVKTTGDVMIDLQGHGTPPDDPAKTTASPGALHLKSSGLSFNEKTGIALTKASIEFELPQGKGSAVGAVYDSKAMSLHLVSNVRLRTTPTSVGEKKMGQVTITSIDADIFDLPREAILSRVHVEDEQGARNMTAGRLTILLRDDNTIETAFASEGVSGSVTDRNAARGSTAMRASEARLLFGAANDLKTADLTGAVKMDSQGGARGEMHASAGKAELDFGAKTQLDKIHATQSVVLSNTAGQGKQDSFALNADVVDFTFKPGNQLDHAVTSGAAQVTLDSKPGSGQKNTAHTLVTADRFESAFTSHGGTKNRLLSAHGIGNTKVVSTVSSGPSRVTTGRDLLLKFDRGNMGGVSAVEQTGDFKYTEGARKASADRATLDVIRDLFTLIGSPHVQDDSQGFNLTADAVKMNHKTGGISADGQVKATYNQPKSNPDGAMFSSQNGEPVHATAQSLTANKNSGIATFAGHARLWQGANLVEAPQITFDREGRNLTAEGQGTGQNEVRTAFVQTDKSGKVTPVSVVAGRLVYAEIERKARFDGGVRLKSADTTMVADQVDIFLKAKSEGSAGGRDSASQIDHIQAGGQIVIAEQNPVRRVTGSQLTYTSDEGKFVMTGVAGKPPSIFDAERGNVTGDSLTFYTRDDRVQIGSGENSRAVTRTRIKDERKP